MFPLKHLSILYAYCYYHISKSTPVFLRKLKCFCALFVVRFIFLPKLKKNNITTNGVSSEHLQKIYKIYCKELSWCQQNCVFSLVWCQNNAGHLSLCQLTGRKDPFREKPLDCHRFLESLCMATQLITWIFFLYFLLLATELSFCSWNMYSGFFFWLKIENKHAL